MDTNKNNDYLSAIRGFALDLIDGELTDQDTARLEMIVSTLAQIRADGAPDYPITEYIKSRYGFEQDNDGQSVIYLDDAPAECGHMAFKDDCPSCEYLRTGDHSDKCPSCGELYEVEVEDGEDCLECQAEEKEVYNEGCTPEEIEKWGSE